MSNKDSFVSGLIAGAAFGSLAGGLLGILIGTSISDDPELVENLLDSQDTEKQKSIKELDSTEVAHQSLEAQIAQLNQAIDEVRQQIDNVNGNLINTQIFYIYAVLRQCFYMTPGMSILTYKNFPMISLIIYTYTRLCSNCLIRQLMGIYPTIGYSLLPK